MSKEKECDKNKCPFRKKYKTCGYCHKQQIDKMEGYIKKEECKKRI